MLLESCHTRTATMKCPLSSITLTGFPSKPQKALMVNLPQALTGTAVTVWADLPLLHNKADAEVRRITAEQTPKSRTLQAHASKQTRHAFFLS